MIIYKVTNLLNGKIYIGQTSNTLEYRQKQHFREARSEKESKRRNNYFHNALNKYGEENFSFEQIDKADTQEELDEKERYWIQFYDSLNKEKGYNLDSGGVTGNSKSEETKRKIGDTTIEKWKNPEIREKMLAGLRKGSEEFSKRCKEKLVPCVCPICGKTVMRRPFEAKKYITCSTKCASQLPVSEESIQKGRKTRRKHNIESKLELKDNILLWCRDNQDIIINCPYNKITTNLQPMLNKLNIVDIRSIFVCFDVKNRKELLTYFKNYIKSINENIC